MLETLRDLVAHKGYANAAILSVVGEHEVAAADRELNAWLQRFSSTQDQESRWLAVASEANLTSLLRDPLIPGGQCSVTEAWLQVCMHSHGHRAQVAKRLRQHGAVPPPTDFINWLIRRPAAAWPVAVTPPGT
jgi:uncharacterized damage-inducible protein DinB